MGRNRWQGRRFAVVGAAATVTLLLGGCGNMADDARNAELCGQYEQLVAAADQFRDQDVTGATAEELRESAEQFRDQLNQVQAVAEGRLDTAISNLEARLDDLRQSAVEAGVDLRETVADLWEDDLDQIAESWAVVRDAADTLCSE